MNLSGIFADGSAYFPGDQDETAVLHNATHSQSLTRLDVLNFIAWKPWTWTEMLPIVPMWILDNRSVVLLHTVDVYWIHGFIQTP